MDHCVLITSTGRTIIKIIQNMDVAVKLEEGQIVSTKFDNTIVFSAMKPDYLLLN